MASTISKTELSDIDQALCRATLYSALALGFRPPAEETITRLAGKEENAALAEAAAALDGSFDSELAPAVFNLTRVNQSFPDIAQSYPRLFGHTVRGLAPPYETEYGSEAIFQQAHELGDLAGFYHAFGLVLNSKEHERADHLSCECEFLSFLALKEAYALEQFDTPMLEEVRKATRVFLQDHLARFVPAFARKLATEDGGGFYGALSALCLSFTLQECARFGVPAGAESLGLRPADDDRVPMACGSGAECTAMPGVCAPDQLEGI
ncbi:MAG: molecular chaperone TorD family protein [Deltaproteobacteria bacterium]|nr:molecular chaperone TorD family protein [Deltaproteobacteria bacterium]